MNKYEWDKEDFAMINNSNWENTLILLQSKKFNNIDFNKVCIEDIIKIEELLEDCFISAQDYTPDKQGFKQYIKDAINYNSKKEEKYTLKNKIKVYIKEPNMPEYIQLWDKFDEDTVEIWCDKRYVNHQINKNSTEIIVATNHPYNSKDYIRFRI